MMDKLNKLMEKKKAEGKTLSPVAKDAKMGVLKDLHKMASDSMASKLGNLKKVTVAAPDEEGLKAGLDKAKDLVGHEPGMPEDSSEGDDKELEAKEEMLHTDLDHDGEEGESEEHKEAVLGEGHDDGDEESDEELTAKIAELLAKQHARKAKRP